ncbi:MAG: hypothetical protein VCD00_20740, partial [Candidatus Hydrogenedentota bacterium]
MNTSKVFPWLRVSSLALCGALVFAGCGGGSEEAPADDSDNAPAATETAAASASTSAAGLAGKISFSGTAPERTVIDTEGDAKCSAMHDGEPLLSETVVVSADGALANVFLYIKNPPEGDYPAPAAPVVLDQ